MEEELYQSEKFGFMSEIERRRYIEKYCNRRKWELLKCLKLNDIQTFIAYGLITMPSDRSFFKDISNQINN